MDATQAAITLKRTKQQMVHRSNFPKEMREKILKEKLTYYKQQLKQALAEKNTDFMKQTVKKLVQVRADLFTLRTEGITDEDILTRELKHYYSDCYSLMSSFQPFV